MKNEILEKVSPQLEEMAKFMKFGRKKLKDEITCSLIDFHGVHLSLGEERNKYKYLGINFSQFPPPVANSVFYRQIG
jgi:hypothetical protein